MESNNGEKRVVGEEPTDLAEWRAARHLTDLLPTLALLPGPTLERFEVVVDALLVATGDEAEQLKAVIQDRPLDVDAVEEFARQVVAAHPSSANPRAEDEIQ